MNPANIRIPTKDAPAAHHLAFICAVAELTHRVLESVTGLRVDLHVSIHNSSNPERAPELAAAAITAGLDYDESDGVAWYEWEPNGYHSPAVTIFVARRAAPAVALEPETSLELHQLVTTEFEAAALVADDFERALDERDAQGVTVAERIERR